MGGHYQCFPRSGAGKDGQVPPLENGDSPCRGAGPGNGGKLQGLIFVYLGRTQLFGGLVDKQH